MTDEKKPPPIPEQNEQCKIDDYLMDLGNLNLDEIVGQEEAVNELRNLVNSIKLFPVYQHWHIPRCRGVLLTGPTGVGKTASVRAMAKELDDRIVLMELRYIDIASKWVDKPIEMLRGFLSLAENYSKHKSVVIFIDEIESMLPQRDEQLHETSVKRVDVFLEWMGGGLGTHDNITIIGSTNKPELMDEAAKRPGRFDKIVKFNQLTPEEIIRGIDIHFSKRSLSSSQISDIDYNIIHPLLRIGTLTGADIPEIINRLLNHKLLEHVNNMRKANKPLNKLSREAFMALLADAKYFPEPICSEDLFKITEEYIQYKKKVGNLSKTGDFGFQPLIEMPKMALETES